MHNYIDKYTELTTNEKWISTTLYTDLEEIEIFRINSFRKVTKIKNIKK